MIVSLLKNPYLNIIFFTYFLYTVYIQANWLELLIWIFYVIVGLFGIATLSTECAERDLLQAALIHVEFWETALHDYFDHEND